MLNTENTQTSEENIEQSGNSLRFDATGQDQINIPEGKFISDSEISREGQDLILETNNGDRLVIDNYFSAQDAPTIQSPDGSILTENLVNSFLKNSSQYAQMGTLNDESPIGAVEELEGSVTIIRSDGSSEPATLGTPVYEGDIIETASNGAANIMFLDETSLAVSDNARVSVDAYKFDAATESGETNLSVLRGVFVYTSGLIGRDDPDDVLIETPVGSIGIRGTIIAGNIKPEGKSEITVLEGAIVVSNGEGNVTLSQQFETVKINGFNENIEQLGVKDAGEMKVSYGSVQNVIPKLFSSINDNIRENNKNSESNTEKNDNNTQDFEQESQESIEEETLEKDASSDVMQDSKMQAVSDAIQEMKELSQQSDDDRTTAKEASPKTINYITNQDGLKQFEFQSFRKTKGKVTNVEFANVEANGETLSAPVVTQKFDYNGDGVTDTIQSDPTQLSGNGTFTVLSGDDGLPLIQGQGSTGQGLGNNYVFIGDTDNDGKLDFAVSATNNGNGKVYEYEIGTNSPTNTINGFTGSKFGVSLSELGDFDGDGRSDYVIGAPDANSSDGIVRIQMGNGTHIDINGQESGDQFGSFVANAGDINNASQTDLLVGSSSAVYLYVPNNDGNNAFRAGSFKSSGKILTANGIGDINGDGFDDFAISVQHGDLIKTHAIYGKAGSYGNVDLDTLGQPENTVKSFTIDHEISLGSDQYIIRGIGDKDGLGYDDFQIGVDGGQQFVVHGRKSSGSNVIDQDTNNDGVLTATTNDAQLVGDFDFDDNNKARVSMKGSSHNNEFKIKNDGFLNIDGGFGDDTIKIDGNLDFSSIDFEQISQIEQISLGSSDGLTLTEENIFNLLKSSDTNTLRINGENLSTNPGDESSLMISVNGSSIDSDIASLATDLGGSDNGVTADGYHHIQIGVYNLYIDTDINLSAV